jgi:hypothetical protein
LQLRQTFFYMLRKLFIPDAKGITGRLESHLHQMRGDALGTEEPADRRVSGSRAIIRRAALQGAMSPSLSDPKCAEKSPVSQGKNADPSPATKNIHPRGARSRMKESSSG